MTVLPGCAPPVIRLYLDTRGPMFSEKKKFVTWSELDLPESRRASLSDVAAEGWHFKPKEEDDQDMIDLKAASLQCLSQNTVQEAAQVERNYLIFAHLEMWYIYVIQYQFSSKEVKEMIGYLLDIMDYSTDVKEDAQDSQYNITPKNQVRQLQQGLSWSGRHGSAATEAAQERWGATGRRRGAEPED